MIDKRNKDIKIFIFDDVVYCLLCLFLSEITTRYFQMQNVP